MTERLYEDDAQLAAMQAHVVVERAGRGRARPHRRSTPAAAASRAISACCAGTAARRAIADTVKGEGERDPAPARAGRRAAAGRRGGVRRDRLGRAAPPDAHAHGDAPAVQPDQGRRGDRRRGRRRAVAAGFRPAEPAAEGGDRGRAERADRGGSPGAIGMGGRGGAGRQSRRWCAPCRCSRRAAPGACGWCGSGRPRRRSICSPAAARMCARTGEIGRIAVVKIENKGKQNRRIIIAPAETA